ncbi:MAG: peptidoglycan-binding protein [Chitinophagales bacterium]|nr:peptidoglycan-binding protein [Chitinophagales bacterium]
MLKRISTLMIVLVAMHGTSFAQLDENDRPKNAQPGKCYAKCEIPAEYKTVTERVMVKPETKKLITIPAVYETVTEKVMVKEATTVKKIVPAVYETVTEKMLVDEGSERIVVVPAVYETVTEKVMVAPARTEWKKGEADKNCLSADPEDCRVWCLVEIPAEYKTITKTVEKSGESTKTVKGDPQYKTITKRVVKTPERIEEITVPAEYNTITKRVMKTPARTEQKVLPAEYVTVTKREKVKSGSVTEWLEVVCDQNLTTAKIIEIQRALKAKGFNPGPIDNILGPQTRAALVKYQRANNLPVGNLNIETMKALGVSGY